jgi:hypothetical protein
VHGKLRVGCRSSKEDFGGGAKTQTTWDGGELPGQPEPQRWSRVGARRGTSVSDAGGARGAAAAGARSGVPGGPHVRAAGPAAAVPGARGCVWGKPPLAAGNGGGAVPEGRPAGRGRAVGRGLRGRARDAGAAGTWGAGWGRCPRCRRFQHVNKAWRVRRADPGRGPVTGTAGSPSAGPAPWDHARQVAGALRGTSRQNRVRRGPRKPVGGGGAEEGTTCQLARAASRLLWAGQRFRWMKMGKRGREKHFLLPVQEMGVLLLYFSQRMHLTLVKAGVKASRIVCNAQQDFEN